MTTPLQKAAKAVIDRWDSPSWKDQPHTAEYIAELRKALDAEIAQAVEPVAWITDHDEPLLCITEAEAASFCEDGQQHPTPLYLHPPQPQATTAVPEGYVLVPIEALTYMKCRVNTLATLSLKADRYSVCREIKQTIADILAAAQGEKP